MKFSLERQIYSVLGVIFLILVGLQSYSYQKTSHLKEALKSRAHAREMMTSLKELLSVLYEAESLKRGYLITADASFKESFQKVLQRMKVIQSELESLGSELPEFHGGLTQLASGLSQRVDSLSTILVVPHSQLMTHASQETKTGKRITEAVEAMFAKVEMDMQTRLSESQIAVDSDLRALAQWAGVTLILGAVILLVACLYIHRDFRDLSQLIEQGERFREEESDYLKESETIPSSTLALGTVTKGKAKNAPQLTALVNSKKEQGSSYEKSKSPSIPQFKKEGIIPRA